MRTTSLLFIAVLLLAALSVRAEEKVVMGPSAGQLRWLSEERRSEIPFELERNHVIVPVRINGRSVRLVLDTGMPAHGVVLFGGLRVDSIPPTFTGKAVVAGVGAGRTEAQTANDATIELPGLELTQQLATVMPFDRDRSLAFEQRDGVIGYSLFSRFLVRIDFDKMTIIIEDPARRVYSERAAKVPLELVGNIPRVQCEVRPLEGTAVPVELVVDLGASHAVSLKASGDSKIRVPMGAVEANTGRGVGGVVTGYVARITSITLGGQRLENVVASFRTTAHSAPGLEALVRDGNLGADALRRFNVTFDYGGKMMLLEPNSHTKEPFEFDMAGFQYTRTPEGSVVVDRVLPGSPAGESGLAVGDVVINVNDLKVADISLDNLRQLLMQPGKTVTLSFTRNGEMKRMTLTLRRLI